MERLVGFGRYGSGKAVRRVVYGSKKSAGFRAGEIEKKLLCRFEAAKTEIEEVPDFQYFHISVMIKTRDKLPDVAGVMALIRETDFKRGFRTMGDLAEDIVSRIYNHYVRYLGYKLDYIGVRVAPEKSRKFGAEVVWEAEKETAERDAIERWSW